MKKAYNSISMEMVLTLGLPRRVLGTPGAHEPPFAEKFGVKVFRGVHL